MKASYPVIYDPISYEYDNHTNMGVVETMGNSVYYPKRTKVIINSFHENIGYFRILNFVGYEDGNPVYVIQKLNKNKI